jgi:hypothetical protein
MFQGESLPPETEEEQEEREFQQMCDYYGYPRWRKPMPNQAFNPYIGLE